MFKTRFRNILLKLCDCKKILVYYTWRIGLRRTLNRLLKMPNAFSTTRRARDSLKQKLHFHIISYRRLSSFTIQRSKLRLFYLQTCFFYLFCPAQCWGRLICGSASTRVCTVTSSDKNKLHITLKTNTQYHFMSN